MSTRRIRSVSRTAAYLILGAKLVREVPESNGLLAFELSIPDPEPDLTDPETTIPVALYLRSHDLLSERVRVANRKRTEGERA